MPLTGLWIPYAKYCMDINEEKEKWLYRRQFKDFLESLGNQLEVGFSVEQGILNCLKPLSEQWGNDAKIVLDVEEMCKRLRLQVPLKVILVKWGKIRKMQELYVFIQVFLYGKETGGNLNSIIQNAIENILLDMETEGKIQDVLAEKQWEFRIMAGMPLAILGYIKLVSGQYLAVLYQNFAGIFFMTIMLILYGVMCYWGFFLQKKLRV